MLLFPFLILDHVLYAHRPILLEFRKEVQKKSFSSFVEKSLEKKKSIYSKGLTRVFESVFPINDASDKSSLVWNKFS